MNSCSRGAVGGEHKLEDLAQLFSLDVNGDLRGIVLKERGEEQILKVAVTGAYGEKNLVCSKFNVFRGTEGDVAQIRCSRGLEKICANLVGQLTDVRDVIIAVKEGATMGRVRRFRAVCSRNLCV